MISKGIRIDWGSCIEYIGIDLENFENMSPVTTSIEWWKSDKEWVRYNTESRIIRREEGAITIDIAYKQDNNKHLDPQEICFGHATLCLSQGQASGIAQWIDFEGPEGSCDSRWERIENSLIGERKRESASRIQRDQAMFRAALIAIDECCVLTGEKTKEALEAAHIIPAKEGGSEIIENGILLRADIHRLFDAGLFSINKKGKVCVKDEIGQSYSDELDGKKIPTNTLLRVQAAIEYINNLA